MVDCDPVLESMLLDADEFPPNWHKGSPEENDEFSRRAVHHCIVSFTVVNGNAYQELYQYGDQDDAANDYAMLNEYFFSMGNFRVNSLPNI